jgi:hypothetical protein
MVMVRTLLIAVGITTALLAGHAARADEVGTTHVVRRGVSGPVTAPTLPEGRVYQRLGSIPKGPPIEPAWRGRLALYGWGSSVDGTAYDDGTEVDIDVPFEDVLEKLRYAMFAYGEVGYRRWSFAIDVKLIGLGKGLAEQDGFYPSFELDQTTIDFHLGYQIYCRSLGIDAWGCGLYPRRLTVDATAGGRYWNLKQTLEVRSAAAPTLDRVSRESWWDPCVGLRLRWPFAKRWGVNVLGDVGGFGVGSDLTWQAHGVLYYRITRQLQVGVGYRALYVDHVEGEGNAREGIEATFHGPVAGLGFTF